MYKYKSAKGAKEYLASIVLNCSTLRKEEFVFYVPTKDGKLMYEDFTDLEERIVPFSKIVSERKMMAFEDYLRKVQSKTHIDTRLLARKYATLDAITDNQGRDGIYLSCSAGRDEYKAAPIFNYESAFASDNCTFTQVASNLRKLYSKEGPAFTVNERQLITVLEKLPDTHERRFLYRNIKKYPEVFR